MKIIGIDPGSHATGYGVVEVRGGQMFAIGNGTIRTNSSESLPDRLNSIYTQLKVLLEEHRPDQMAVEDLFNAKNARSSLILGHARGVALLAGSLSGIKVSEYAPREVKKALTGNGAATKEQVKFMTMKLLSMRDEPDSIDASDALAVAICHEMRRNVAIRTGGSL